MEKSETNITSPLMHYIGAQSFRFDQSCHHLYVKPPVANSTRFYFSVYGGIIGANLIFTIFRAVLFAFAGLQAAATIHRHMLDAVLQVCKALSLVFKRSKLVFTLPQKRMHLSLLSQGKK